MADQFLVEILPDGTIKSTTDPISPANHASADGFFKLVSEMTGGEVLRKKRSKAHIHQHGHSHEHKHEEA